MLAAGLLVHLVYVPSESNPSDWDSREMQRRKAINRPKDVDVRYDGKIVKRKRSKLEIQLAAHRKRMEWLNKWGSEHGIDDRCSASASSSLDGPCSFY